MGGRLGADPPHFIYPVRRGMVGAEGDNNNNNNNRPQVTRKSLPTMHPGACITRCTVILIWTYLSFLYLIVGPEEICNIERQIIFCCYRRVVVVVVLMGCCYCLCWPVLSFDVLCVRTGVWIQR